MVMMVELERVLEEMDVSTAEALAYVKYFGWKRRNGFKRKWEHYTIRLFVLSVADLGNGYFSALRKVRDEVIISDAREMELYNWLKGWIFKRDKSGQWWIVVDGDSEDFGEFKRVYAELKSREK